MLIIRNFLVNFTNFLQKKPPLKFLEFHPPPEKISYLCSFYIILCECEYENLWESLFRDSAHLIYLQLPQLLRIIIETTQVREEISEGKVK